jgi:type 1 fimbriae regulatory protein FimB
MPKAWSTDELLKVLKVAAKDSARNHCMILLGYCHGLRASEVCGLKLADLDLPNRQITIRRLKHSLKTVQPLADIPGQPLMSELRVLRRWLSERSQNNDRSDFVFLSQKGGALTRVQFFRIVQTYAERAGLPPSLRFAHALKHSCAVHLVERNVNLAIVKQALGHKNISSTIIYAEPSDDAAGKAVLKARSELF